MPWIILLLAGLFEIGFTICLKLSSGLTRPGWTIAFIVLAACSFLLLSQAMKSIPLGTAYAVWTGIGAAGTALVGMLLFKDPATFWRIFFICTLIGSVVGLKAATSEPKPPAPAATPE